MLLGISTSDWSLDSTFLPNEAPGWKVKKKKSTQNNCKENKKHRCFCDAAHLYKLLSKQCKKPLRSQGYTIYLLGVGCWDLVSKDFQASAPYLRLALHGKTQNLSNVVLFYFKMASCVFVCLFVCF